MSKKIKKQGSLVSLLSILFIFSYSAHAESGKELIDGKLAACPDKPNCINTEKGELEPISFDLTNADKAWLILQTAIKELGGEIKKSDSNYLWAIFQTSVIKFTDDVEAKLDIDNKVIHFRSASRVGYYDFNANKNRLQRIIKKVSRKLNTDRLSNTHE